MLRHSLIHTPEEQELQDRGYFELPHRPHALPKQRPASYQDVLRVATQTVMPSPILENAFTATEREMKEFYFGLSDTARLVTRANSGPFIVPEDMPIAGFAVARPKVFRHFNDLDRKFLARFKDSQLLREIQAILTLGTQATCLCCHRIAYDNHPSEPKDDGVLTLLIGVEPRTITWTDATIVVHKCKASLEGAGFRTVEVEMFEEVDDTDRPTDSFKRLLDKKNMELKIA